MTARSLIIHGGYKSPSGYGTHARELVRALDKLGIRVRLVNLPLRIVELPEEKRDSWFDTLELSVDASAAVHICMPHQARIADGMLNVNYTTFETTRIPESWVSHSLNQDLVILPSDSSKRAWIASGVPEERLRLCPFGVDSNRFHPGVEPLALRWRMGRRVLEYKTRFLNVSDLVSAPRKNILAMLRLWIKTTRATDDAILIMKLSGYRHSWWRPDKLERALSEMESQLGKSRKKAAPIFFYDQVLSDSEMPRLYATATHYWSMSHGEGWDMPMMEAAATNLHLIAPAHSAYTAYLDDSVAQMIPSLRIPADFNGGNGIGKFFKGSDWWAPDEAAAASFLRHSIETRGQESPTARARMVKDFTWEQSAQRLIAILEELHEQQGRS